MAMAKTRINDGAGAKSPGVKAGGDPNYNFRAAGANVKETRLPNKGSPRKVKTKSMRSTY